jgi:hypothetical protein
MSHDEGQNTLTGRTKRQDLSPVVRGYNEGLIDGFARAAKMVEERTNGLLTLVEPRDIQEARARKARSR